MKKLWHIGSRTVLYGALVFALYLSYTELYLNPCERTQTYSIGEIDLKFQITTSELADVLERAEFAWEAETGIYRLFEQVPEGGDILVNLLAVEQDMSPGVEFNKGDYYSRTGEINIFQYDDIDDLLLVLTHEFGHALGMEHVADEQAVMSDVLYQEAGFEPSLKQADLQEFRRVCRLARV